MSPKRSGLSLPSAGNSGRPSSAMFNLPEEPRILKFFARLTNSGLRSFGSNSFGEGALGVEVRNHDVRAVLVAVGEATPVTRLPLTRHLLDVGIGHDLAAEGLERTAPAPCDTAPMPPRAKPHEPIDPSTSPM